MGNKTSLFHRGLARDLLKRFWPLWTGYFAVLLMCLPARLSSTLRYRGEDAVMMLNRAILDNGRSLVLLCFIACVLMAMAMFGFLYNQRSCGMMCALPIRRETVFITAYLTGLAPMLAADGLTAGLTALIYGEYLAAGSLWTWLAMAALCKLCFYGIAVFCAMLTGSILILPALYLVLNFAADLAESAADAVLRILVYGYSYSGGLLRPFSPVVVLFSTLNARLPAGEMQLVENIKLNGFTELCVYAAVGLLLALAALWLYRRRCMETASDAVAVDILKPIFKYCMCFGGAGVFCAAMYNWFFDNMLSGTAAALLVLALLLTGAFLGYFAAEMLLQKTVRVFGGKWRGFIISCCILVALSACVEYDVFGYERYTPEPTEIEKVQLELMDTVTLTEGDSIAAAAELHELVIQSKAENERAGRSQFFALEYFMKDGRKLERRYYLDCEDSLLEEPSSQVSRALELTNCLEAREQRFKTVLPVTAEHIKYSEIYATIIDDKGNYDSEGFTLTAAEAADFYNNCVLPDVKDSSLGSRYISDSPEYRAKTSNVQMDMNLWDRNNSDAYDFISFTVTMDAARCKKWIEERGLELQPVSAVEDAAQKYS